MRNIYALFIVLISFISVSLGQGTIAGKITDAKTGEGVIGANVVIQGSNPVQGAATDIEGNFLINNVKEGSYVLQISSVTYKTHTVPDVKVETAKKITIDVPLAEDVSELEAVVVQGVRQTDTDFELLRSIKESRVIVVGITAEQIGRSLDRDAAQVVRRVPGVNIRDNQFVQVRGLSERYNAVMLHNAYAPSVETDVRSFSFANIPSSQLDRILVFKSPAADLPGDFAGGVVKIFTKSIPEENSFIVDYSTQIRSGTTFKDFYSQESSDSKWTGFNDKFYDLPEYFPKNLRVINSSGEITAAGQSLKNLWTPVKGTAIPDQRLTLTFNRRFNIGKILVGNITSVNYSNSFATFNVERSDFNDYNTTTGASAPIYNFQDKQYNQLIRAGLLFNWAFKFDENNTIEIKNLYNQNSTDQFVSRAGFNYESAVKLDNGSFDKVYRGIYSGQLLGTHDLFKKSTSVEWLAGYNTSYKDQPDYKRYRTDIDPSNGDRTLFIPIGAVAPDFLGRFYGNLKESSVTGGASIKQRFGFGDNPLMSPEIKAGVFFEKKDREFGARNMGFIRSSVTIFDTNLQKGTIAQLFEPQNINGTWGIKIDEQSNPNDNYTASNDLRAYYLMGSIPITKKFKIDAGVRIEDNIQKLKSATQTGTRIDTAYHTNFLLPSANMSYNFSEKMLVRAAYGETVNRPEFRELAPFSFYDFNFNFTNRGNPNLRVAKIQNFDFRWEFYPSKNELITVGAFYKNFTNPIEVLFIPGGGSQGAKNFTFDNPKGATNYGVEVEIKKSLLGLTGSKIVDNITAVFNAALIKSEVDVSNLASQGQAAKRPLQGQAPYIMNLALFYTSEASGWQVNALYNVVGKNIVFVGFQGYPDLYIMPRNIIDLTFSKQLGERFILKGGISDILNQPFLILQDGNQDGEFDAKKDQVIQQYRPGQVFSFGFSYRF